MGSRRGGLGQRRSGCSRGRGGFRPANDAPTFISFHSRADRGTSNRRHKLLSCQVHGQYLTSTHGSLEVQKMELEPSTVKLEGEDEKNSRTDALGEDAPKVSKMPLATRGSRVFEMKMCSYTHVTCVTPGARAHASRRCRSTAPSMTARSATRAATTAGRRIKPAGTARAATPRARACAS